MGKTYNGEYTQAEYRRHAQKVLDKTKKEHSKYNWKATKISDMPRTVIFEREGLKNAKEVTNAHD